MTKTFLEYITPRGEIYLDMDETLCGFIPGANAVFEKAGYPHWEHHYWDTHEKDKETEIKWSLINSTPHFWDSLEFLPEGRKLWSYINRELRIRPNILSALPKEGTAKARTEKTLWLAKNLGINNLNKIHLVNRSDKVKFAKANGVSNILVDDYDKNCREFNAAGGIAIEITSASDVIKQLKSFGY